MKEKNLKILLFMKKWISRETIMKKIKKFKSNKTSINDHHFTSHYLCLTPFNLYPQKDDTNI